MDIGGVAFSPAGNIVAATADDNLQNPKWDAVYAWDLSANRRAVFTDPGSAGVFRLTFSPSGNTLAVEDRNASTYLWSMGWLEGKCSRRQL
jgi:dipeptidyl aminopeptidase/acylaminoacyl peptidase